MFPGPIKAFIVISSVIILYTASEAESKILVIKRRTYSTQSSIEDVQIINSGIWKDPIRDSYLVYAEPASACNSTLRAPPRREVTNLQGELKDRTIWILLASISDCTLAQKQASAVAAGYSALILHNVGSDVPYQLYPFQKYIQGLTGIDISLIGEKDGMMLKERFTYPKQYIVQLEADENERNLKAKQFLEQLRTTLYSTELESFVGIVLDEPFLSFLLVVLLAGLYYLFSCMKSAVYWFLRLTREEQDRISRAPVNVAVVEAPVYDPVIIPEDIGLQYIDPATVALLQSLRISIPNDFEAILARRDVDEFPNRVYSKTDEADREECAICLDFFADSEELPWLPCGHYFHRACLVEWFQSSFNQNCPLCRTRMGI